MMASERLRLETNQNIGIQAEPQVRDAEQQVDFVKNVARAQRGDKQTMRNIYPTSSRFFDFDENGMNSG
jgi:hypothetical protein